MVVMRSPLCDVLGVEVPIVVAPFGPWDQVALAAAVYEARLAPYRSGASTAKFQLSKPIPLDLIARITKLLAEQHETRPAPCDS